MMCFIHFDESATHVPKTACPTRLYLLFAKELDNLLDRLDNQRMMHDSRNVAIDCRCGNQNDTHYCSGTTPSEL
jgi:hypothetical protein